MSLDLKALERLVKGSGLSYRENTVSWIFVCPKCNKDKLYLRRRDGRFICWKCATTDNFQGRPEYALRELLRAPLNEIRQALYGVVTVSEGPYIKVELSDFFDEDDEVPPDLLEPPPEAAFPLDFYEIDEPYAALGRAYLESRGIPLAVAKELGLRYHPQERRVVFPIVVGGKLRGWQRRTIDKDRWIDEQGVTHRLTKILTGPDSFDRESTFMFHDSLETSDHAVLCEGPVDGIKARLCGGVIVAMGKSVSRGQVEVIKRWAEAVRARAGKRARLYLAVDPDAAREITRLCREFVDLDIFQLQPPRGTEDLGKMSFGAVLSIFRVARRIGPGHVFLPPAADFFTTQAAPSQGLD